MLGCIEICQNRRECSFTSRFHNLQYYNHHSYSSPVTILKPLPRQSLGSGSPFSLAKEVPISLRRYNPDQVPRVCALRAHLSLKKTPLMVIELFSFDFTITQ